MKFIKAILGTGILYFITILTQYGYNSYFGIPANYIEASIRDNVVFFFGLLKLAEGVLGLMSFWAWAGLVVLFLIIWILWILKILSGTLLNVLLVIITISSFFGFYNFGNLLAKSATEFYVLPDGCIPTEDKNITYIIPTFYQTTALIVPIYKDSNKLTGNFFSRDTSDLKCEIQTKKIGKILK